MSTETWSNETGEGYNTGGFKVGDVVKFVNKEYENLKGHDAKILEVKNEGEYQYRIEFLTGVGRGLELDVFEWELK